MFPPFSIVSGIFGVNCLNPAFTSIIWSWGGRHEQESKECSDLALRRLPRVMPCVFPYNKLK